MDKNKTVKEMAQLWAQIASLRARRNILNARRYEFERRFATESQSIKEALDDKIPKLVRLRLQSGLAPSAVAQQLAISVATVNKIRRGVARK